MKYLIGQLAYILTGKNEKNLRMLLKFSVVLVAMITVYSIVFHLLMMKEGKEYSWITGFYWTLTVMSTLGFGDITFESNVGRLFSILVLLSGIVFLLIMLPFTFIQFFYAPWLEAKSKSRAPRRLPETVKGHVILTDYDSVMMALVERLKWFEYQYVIICEDIQKALELVDTDYEVVVGDLGDPDTYKHVNADKAALVVAGNNDIINTNVAFTVREVSAEVPVAASADLDDSVDILHLAGSTHVFQFRRLLGESLARRVIRSKAQGNIVANIDSLYFSEVAAIRTTLVGRKLRQSGLRETTGLTVAGIWEKGRFEMATAETVIQSTTVLLVAGSMEQLRNYDRHFKTEEKTDIPVLILGGGRVGRATAESLEKKHIDYRIIERNRRLITDDRDILGSAADYDTLKQAGIKNATSVIITTHDNPTNVYLTIYCRKLRPDIQIISRATKDRNIPKLHAAGADLVMSYSSLAANTILNLLKPGKTFMLAEGLHLFRVNLHPSLAGKSLAESEIRLHTGCNVIAINDGKKIVMNPDPSLCFRENDELIVIGTDESEKRFFRKYPEPTKH